MDVTFTAAYLKKILIIAYLEQVANGAKKVAFIHSFLHVHHSFPGGGGALNFFGGCMPYGFPKVGSRE